MLYLTNSHHNIELSLAFANIISKFYYYLCVICTLIGLDMVTWYFIYKLIMTELFDIKLVKLKSVTHQTLAKKDEAKERHLRQ